MHVIVINEKRGHEFKKDWERLYGKDFWEEIEGRNIVIIILTVNF